MTDFQTNRSRSGSLMVEAMVGISVFVVGILGILQLVGQSLGLNQLILSQFTASHLAGEGIELVKNVVDGQVALGNGWGGAQLAVPDGTWEVSLDVVSGVISLNRLGPPSPTDQAISPLSATQFQVDDSIPEYTYDTGNAANLPTTFRRTLSITWEDPDPGPGPTTGEMRRATVRSRVDWTIRNAPYSIEVDDRFYTWRVINALP